MLNRPRWKIRQYIKGQWEIIDSKSCVVWDGVLEGHIYNKFNK